MSLPQIDIDKLKSEYTSLLELTSSAIQQWLRTTPGGETAVLEISGINKNTLYQLQKGYNAAGPYTIDRLQKIEDFPVELGRLLYKLHEKHVRITQLRLLNSNNALTYAMYLKNITNTKALAERAGVPDHVIFHLRKWGISEGTNKENLQKVADALKMTPKELIKLQEDLHEREHKLITG